MDIKFTNDNKMNIKFSNEFGFELRMFIPFAYYLFKRGILNSTTSVNGTKDFYYFSPKHIELNKTRTWSVTEVTFLDKIIKDFNNWLPPPYKEIYKNDVFVFDKPIYIIHNKDKKEWGIGSINTIGVKVLEMIIKKLKDKYQIIYFRPIGNEKGFGKDDCDFPILKLKDFEMLQNHPEVLTIQQLLKQYPDYTYNQIQLMVHANCNKFISVQGGSSVIASYFEGENIVLIKCNYKFTNFFHNYSADILKKLSNANIIDVKNDFEILSTITSNI